MFVYRRKHFHHCKIVLMKLGKGISGISRSTKLVVLSPKKREDGILETDFFECTKFQNAFGFDFKLSPKLKTLFLCKKVSKQTNFLSHSLYRSKKAEFLLFWEFAKKLIFLISKFKQCKSLSTYKRLDDETSDPNLYSHMQLKIIITRKFELKLIFYHIHKIQVHYL